MPEAILEGLRTIWHLDTLLLAATGVIIGLFFGVLPGLSGIVALTILVPLIYEMQQIDALVFLLAVHSVVYSGGAVTAILLNIPGAPPNAATLIDGFPLTLKGEGGRALGAALLASMLGGCMGAFLLAGLIPLVSSVVMLFGSPETFLLAVLALAGIATVSTQSLSKGLISSGLGILISFVGYQDLTGVPRLTFGSLYLYDGIHLVPLALGLFALPEMLELSARGGTVARDTVTGPSTTKEVLQGMADTCGHWWLVLRCSALGALVGIVPGVGGETAPFVAYGYAKQSSKERASFGAGNIEGVIAPESANNAKEGGALLPTLAFGIPGSSSMAILLGAFLVVGLTPGPAFLAQRADVAYALIATLVLANVLACILLLALASSFARLAFVRVHLFVPLILGLITLGAFSARGYLTDVWVTLLLGILGYVAKRYGYSRPALLLGYVLGSVIETYLYISLDAYGPIFLLRPISLLLLALTAALLYRGRHLTGRPAADQFREEGRLPVTLFLLIPFVLALSVTPWDSLQAALGPWVVGLPMLLLLVRQAYGEARGVSLGKLRSQLTGIIATGHETAAAGWILGLFLLISVAGFALALPIFGFIYLRYHKEQWGWIFSLVLTLWLLYYFVFVRLLTIPVYPGLLLGGL